MGHLLRATAQAEKEKGVPIVDCTDGVRFGQMPNMLKRQRFICNFDIIFKIN